MRRFFEKVVFTFLAFAVIGGLLTASTWIFRHQSSSAFDFAAFLLIVSGAILWGWAKAMFGKSS